MLDIGPGLAAWISSHQAFPLSSEFGDGNPWARSAVEIEIGNAQGQKVHTLVGWDNVENSIMEPGPGFVTANPAVPASQPPVGAIPEAAIEQANQQGYDATCGARTVVEAAMEDGLLPVDATQGKALVDELWNLVNPGISEMDDGMDLSQQMTCILHVAQKYGKHTTICPFKGSLIPGVNDQSALPDATVFPDGTNRPIKHMTVAVNLTSLLRINSNHFLLKREDDTDVAQDAYWEILDSCHNIDGDPDRFMAAQIVQAGADIFGGGPVQIGWAWTWHD